MWYLLLAKKVVILFHTTLNDTFLNVSYVSDV